MQNNTSSDVKFFNVTPITGSETKEILQGYKANLDKCLALPKYQADIREGEVIPTTWRTIIVPWFVVDSEAWKIFQRKDLETPHQVFDVIMSRKASSSTNYNQSLQEFIANSCKPKTVDEHLRAVQDFTEDLVERRFLALGTLDHIDEIDETKTKREIVDAVRVSKERSILEIRELIQEVISHEFMMSLVSKQQFQTWDVVGRTPLQSSSGQICDWLGGKQAQLPLDKKLLKFYVGPTAVAPIPERDTDAARKRDHAREASEKNRQNQLKKNAEQKAEKPELKRKSMVPYSGPSCTKCADPIKAKSHSTERHRDDYITNKDFHANKRNLKKQKK
jgi:hypothetical protein